MKTSSRCNFSNSIVPFWYRSRESPVFNSDIESVVLALRFPHLERTNYQNKLQCCLDIRQRSWKSQFFISCKGTQAGQPWLSQGESTTPVKSSVNTPWSRMLTSLINYEFVPALNWRTEGGEATPSERDGANTRNPSWPATGAALLQSLFQPPYWKVRMCHE